MAPSEITVDYYATLEIPQSANLDTVKENYRRLARLRHPDKNLNNRAATASFQTLVNAYETISDPVKRKAYDSQWERIKTCQNAQEEAKKRQAEAVERERKRAADERDQEQRAQSALQVRLRPLKQAKSRYDSEIFEMNRVIRRLASEWKHLQDQDMEELRKDKEKHSWWAYMISPVYGMAQETEEQKQHRERESLQRLASKRIKRSEMTQKEAKLNSLEQALEDVNKKIKDEVSTYDAKRRQEDMRKEQERIKKMQETMRKEQEARWEAQQQEEQERRAKWAREAEERQRTAQAARKAQQAQERARTAQDSARQQSRHSSHQAPTSANRLICRHAAFWPKVQGMHTCSNCYILQRRFAFKCPGCQIIACASCRQSLRGERGRNNSNFNRQYGRGRDMSPEFDYPDYD